MRNTKQEDERERGRDSKRVKEEGREEGHKAQERERTSKKEKE